MRCGSFVLLFNIFVLCHSAPVVNKEFHEHVEDFIGLILAESGLQLEQLLRKYGEEKDFGIAVTYFRTTNFTELFHEVESLQEFKDVVKYLESANIDVSHILECIDELVEQNERVKLEPSKNKNGETVLVPFIRESMNLVPKEKLAALFEEKQEEFPDFRDSVEKLKSEQWKRLFGALWSNEEFKRAINTLAENGLDVRLLIREIKNSFGQSN